MTYALPVIQPSSRIPEGRKPAWLKVRAPGGPNYMRLKSRLREWNLHSVCEEAHCPNIGECWEDATATFMILGDICTRNCGYCAIAHGTPVWEDREEPERIGRAVGELGLEYVVITSVNRDDLAAGGATHCAPTGRAAGRHAPRARGRAGHPDQVGHQPRRRRGAGGADRGDARPARGRRVDPDARPVPAAVTAAPARRALLPSRRVRGARGGRPGARVRARRGGAARPQLVPRQAPGGSCAATRSEQRHVGRSRVAPCLRPPAERAGLAHPVTMTYAPMLMTFAFAALVAGALLGIPKLIAPRRLTPVK